MTAEVTPIKAWEKPWIDPFLEALAEYGNVVKSCKKAKVSRAVAYRERDTNPLFFASWKVAEKLGVEGLEDEARRRAFEGVKRTETKYYLDKKLGTKTIVEYSDTLLIFLLKAHKRDVYGDTSRNVNIDLNNCSIEQLERIAAGEDPVKVLATP